MLVTKVWQNLKNLISLGNKDIFGINKKEFNADFMNWLFSNSNYLNSLSISDYQKLYTGWVYTCVSAIADSIAGLDRKLYFSKDRTDREVFGENLMNLIDSKLLIEIVSHLELTGSFFILQEKIGKNVESVKVLNPSKITINQDYFGNIESFFYNSSDGRVFKYEKDEIIFYSSFNPLSDNFRISNGISPTSAIARQFLSDSEAIKWNSNFFRNNGSHGTVFTSDKSISPDIQKRFLEKYKEEFAGTDNAFKTLFLDNGVRVEKAGISQKDMDFTEQRRFTRDEVFAIFKVPKILLGISDTGYVDRENSIKSFTEFKIKPLAKIIEEIFNKYLFKNKGYFCFENITPVDKTAVKDDYLRGISLLKEARASLGYSELPNTDHFINGVNPFKKDEENSNNDTDSEINSEGQDDEKSLEKIISKNFKVLQKGTEEWKEKRWQKKIERTDKYENDFKNKMISIFDSQENLILNKIEKGIKKLPEENENNWFNSVFNQDFYDIGFVLFYEVFLKKEGQFAISEIDSSLIFDIHNVEKWIGKNIKKMAKNIDETTKKEIFEIIKIGTVNGDSTPKIVKNIRSKFSEYKVTRTNTIARTEVARGLTFSRIEAWTQAKVEQKEWFTALDEKVCASCGPMHGKVIGLTQHFFKLGDKLPDNSVVLYEDIIGSPLHPNCRCDILPVIE